MPALILALLPILLPELEKLVGAILAQVNATPPPPNTFEIGMRLTQEHVQNFELSIASGEEKRLMARAALSADVLRLNLPLDTAAQNLMIEIAYNALKPRRE